MFGPDKEDLADKFCLGFESRPQQLKMAQAVIDAFSQRRHLLVEAGTGVGKSLAYLLPLLKWAMETDGKAVISTYTKTLQEQLIRSDLPRLNSLLDLKLNYALCLGGNNYLCLRRLRHNHSSELFEGRAKREIEAITKWADRTTTGLLTELEFSPGPRVWDNVCRDRELCLGKRCGFRKECFYARAKTRERNARILVTNHHLFFANAASGGSVLPRFEAVVFDEAHTLEQVATGYMGLEISNFKLKYLLDTLAGADRRHGFIRTVGASACLKEDVRAKTKITAEAVTRFFNRLARQITGSGPIRIRRPFSPDPQLSDSLSSLEKALLRLRKEVGEDEDKVELKRYASRVAEFRAGLETIQKMGLPDYVYWLESEDRSRGKRITLSAAPVNVSAAFKARVLDLVCPVILTSATLSVNRDFSYIRKNLGFGKEPVDELVLDSPFDFQRNVLLYLPSAGEIPDPVREPENYQQAVTACVKRILKVTNGRTFILFTSFQALRMMGAKLEEAFPEMTILKQGEAPRFRLLEEFRKGDRAVLLGTNTFWQGVDIPGKALECVIIGKLPFLVPDDPVTEARMEAYTAAGKNAFAEYQVPQAVIMLRQGFGRLIRKKSDQGMVAILDPRLRTRFYGKKFLKALPPCKEIDSLQGAIRFFGQTGSLPGDSPRSSTQDCRDQSQQHSGE